ncbi:urease accessory protein UreF [Gluconacetobacter sp. Hr-1-5]|uniref:urease accessory protein UreF n=1 Tax=Gluconacetobacter sp. Hr-1-5 TaxID=3395370 RepID=UPI003B5214DF
MRFARLLAWISPSFPTGGFAYSHGLEWVVESGEIHDVATLVGWITDLLRYGSLHTDLILLRAAWRAETAPERIRVAQVGCALASSRERWEETVQQGEAFLKAAANWPHALPPGFDPRATRWPLPVAHGVAFRASGLDQETVAWANAHAAIASLVSAAVRLVPLGQTCGLRALAALEPTLRDVIDATRDLTLDDAGSLCFRADLAAMKHETQQTRLFRT